MSGIERAWPLFLDAEYESQRAHLEMWHELNAHLAAFLRTKEMSITYPQLHFLTDQVLTFMINHNHHQKDSHDRHAPAPDDRNT
jgi:hypothetical protein